MTARRGHLRLTRRTTRRPEVTSVPLEIGSWTHSSTHGLRPQLAAVQPGLWTKPRVRPAACSTAITKHRRSGPRLRKGAPVYLKLIASMVTSEVQTSTFSPSSPTQTTWLRGEPSARGCGEVHVPRFQHARVRPPHPDGAEGKNEEREEMVAPVKKLVTEPWRDRDQDPDDQNGGDRHHSSPEVVEAKVVVDPICRSRSRGPTARQGGRFQGAFGGEAFPARP